MPKAFMRNLKSTCHRKMHWSDIRISLECPGLFHSPDIGDGSGCQGTSFLKGLHQNPKFRNSGLAPDVRERPYKGVAPNTEMSALQACPGCLGFHLPLISRRVSDVHALLCTALPLPYHVLLSVFSVLTTQFPSYPLDQRKIQRQLCSPNSMVYISFA